MPESGWQKGVDFLSDFELGPERGVNAILTGHNPIEGIFNPDKGVQFGHQLESELLGGYDVTKLPPPVLAAVDFIEQTLSDPISYAPGLDVAVWAPRIPRIASAIRTVSGAVREFPALAKVVERFAPLGNKLEAMAASPIGRALGLPLRIINAPAHLAGKVGDKVGGVVKRGATTIAPELFPNYRLIAERGREATNTMRRGQLAAQASHHDRLSDFNPMVKQYAHFMDTTGNIPRKLRIELQRLLWLEGTKDVRDKLLRDYQKGLSDFAPSKEEKAAPILNIVEGYKPGTYLPMQTVGGEEKAARGPLDIEIYHQGGTKESQFNKKQTSTESSTPLSQRVAHRLNAGSRDVATETGRINILREQGLLGPSKAVVRNGEKAKRYKPGTMGERMDKARQLAQQAIKKGDVKSAKRYVDLLEKQKAFLGENAVDQNIGSRIMPMRSALAKGIPQAQIDHANTVAMPKVISDEFYAPKQRVSIPFLQDIAKMGRETLFTGSGIPHKINISASTFAHTKGKDIKGIGIPFSQPIEGAKTVSEGTRYAREILKGSALGKKIEKELGELGASMQYTSSSDPLAARELPSYYGAMSKVNLGKFNLGDAMVNRYETIQKNLHAHELGNRYAMLQRLKKAGIKGDQLGGELRDMYGDYANKGRAAQFLGDIQGAPFATYHTSVTPISAAKALTQNPTGVHSLLHGLSALNLGVGEPLFGGDLEVPNPILNYGQAISAVDPTNLSKVGPALNYWLSPSDTGPLGVVKDLSGRKWGQAAERIGEYKIPGLGIAAGVLANPAKGLLDYAGIRVKKPSKKTPVRFYPDDYFPR